MKIHTRDGVELYAQIISAHKNCEAPWLIAIHGLGEHLGRHRYLGDLFKEHFHLFQYDLRGHGQSSGESAYVENFADYVRDLQDVLSYLRENYQMKRFALFGHSMGGLIVAKFLREIAGREHDGMKRGLAGIFINAPPVGFSGVTGVAVQRIPKVVLDKLANFFVSSRLGGLVDLDFLSHDPKVKERYMADPYNHLKLHSRLLLQLAKAAREVLSAPLAPPCPAFVTVGSEDRLIGVPSIVHYFTAVEKSFTLRQFEGAFHEIHHEVEQWKAPYLDFLKVSLVSAMVRPNDKMA